jgi:nicotinate phosphoribosyltransferase
MQIIAQIQQEAPAYGLDADDVLNRLVYGVGTRLITSEGDAALDGVYKLVAVEDDAEWVPAIKISETPVKTPNPGRKIAWRVYDSREKATADLLSLNGEDPRTWDEVFLHHPTEHRTSRALAKSDISKIERLHQPIIEDGAFVYESPTLPEMRAARKTDLERLDPGVRRLLNPHIYHVSLTRKLWDLKQTLIREART